MAWPARGPDKCVTEGRKPLLAQAIDNNPTPSYLSAEFGWKRSYPAPLASNLPEMTRFPERRNQNPAAPA
jgi:hypothetical protein